MLRIINKFKSSLYKKTASNISKPKYFLDKLICEIQKFEIVFDVGAFQGQFTQEILSFNEKANVHCFEPSKDSFKILVEKFSNDNRVQLMNVAVSDISGTAKLNINSFKETNSLLESADVSKEINTLTEKITSENVIVIQLDEYCLKQKITKINLLKIDTQGNSFKVLKGLHNLLSQKKIDYLYVEAEFIEIYKNEKLFSEIELLMRSYDYSIIDICNLNYIDNRLGWCDVLFKVKNSS